LTKLIFYILLSFSNTISLGQSHHKIDFCGEVLPISSKKVLKNYLIIVNKIIRHKGTVPAMYQRAMLYFPFIVPILRANGIPDDFKYLAIIESNFENVVSRAGAAGVWQLMPGAAKEIGNLRIDITKGIDERNNLYKSTVCACKYFIFLKKRLGTWTLAAAAYNGGFGMIERKILKTGINNYYFMLLNKETADYVVKISAIKELFENADNLEKVLLGKPKINTQSNEVKKGISASFNSFTFKLNSN